MLKFAVKNQSLMRLDSFRAAEDSVNYLVAEFDILTNDWDGATITATFSNGEKTVDAGLIENRCTVPWEILGKPVLAKVSLFGVKGDKIITTDICSFSIACTLERGSSGEDPTPDAYQQIVNLIEAGKVKGPKGDTGPQGPRGETGQTGPQGPRGETGQRGPQGEIGQTGQTGPAGQDGHTPVKGVDYWTASDKQEIYAEAEQALRDQEQSSVTAIRSAGADEVEKVQIKGAETLESIPEDYSALTAEVSGLKGDISELSERVNSNTNHIAEIEALIGYSAEHIVGIQVDYKNKSFKRLAGAVNLTSGSDFDKYAMFGGRKRCNVADDGSIVAFYGDDNYSEDGSMGQVMVYQPAFYYKVVPLEMDVQTDGLGYHLRKVNYYVSEIPHEGFKRHPLFYDKNNEEIEFALLSAFEGSIFDVSADAFLFADEQVMDNANDKFCSIAGAKPASSKTQDLTRPKVEQMSQNRGSDWHGDLIKAESANQLLMIIEMGAMNLQTAIGQGVVSVSDTPNTENNSKATGQTSSLGNSTGQAEGTAGQVSITYRGVENPWGNIWKYVYGVNIWGNGSMKGGVPYICTDFNFAESKNSGNYESAGFTVTNAGSYISAMGYGGEEYDWLLFASECLGNSSVPVGDYHWVTQNLNGYRIARLGGGWDNGSIAGGFSWNLYNGVGHRSRSIGGRLVYVPTKATATSYVSNITAWKQKMVA